MLEKDIQIKTMDAHEPAIHNKVMNLTKEIQVRDGVCQDIAFIRAWAETIEDTVKKYEELINVKSE